MVLVWVEHELIGALFIHCDPDRTVHVCVKDIVDGPAAGDRVNIVSELDDFVATILHVELAVQVQLSCRLFASVSLSCIYISQQVIDLADELVCCALVYIFIFFFAIDNFVAHRVRTSIGKVNELFGDGHFSKCQFNIRGDYPFCLMVPYLQITVT